MNILTQAVGLLTRVIRTSLAHHKFLYFKYDREAKLCSMSTPIRVTKNLGIPTSAKAAARQHAISSTKTFMMNPDNPFKWGATQQSNGFDQLCVYHHENGDLVSHVTTGTNYNTVIYYTILYYTILYYTILYYSDILLGSSCVVC